MNFYNKNNQSVFTGNLNDYSKEKELSFIHIKIKKGSKKELPRPDIRELKVVERLQKLLEIN